MNNLTLASVKEAFQQWRAGRYSRAEPIPDALWSMALGLYPEHKRSKICDCLRLSGTQFKQRLEDGGYTHTNNGFVVASRDEVKAIPEATSNVQLMIQGKERALTFCVDIQTLGEVLPHIGALL